MRLLLCNSTQSQPDLASTLETVTPSGWTNGHLRREAGGNMAENKAMATSRETGEYHVLTFLQLLALFPSSALSLFFLPLSLLLLPCESSFVPFHLPPILFSSPFLSLSSFLLSFFFYFLHCFLSFLMLLFSLTLLFF